MDEQTDDLRHAEALVGGLTRRRLFTVAGFSVASAAVIAACGKGSGSSTNIPQAGLTPVTTALPNRLVDDITLLRTASSLEHSIIEAYQGLLTIVSDATVKTALEVFLDHHQEHSVNAETATRQSGGDAFRQKNPVVDAGIVQPALKLVSDGGNQTADIVAFAYALETVSAETYQSFVPLLTKPSLRSSAMAVGGSEARHAAVLASLIKDAKPVAPLVVGTGATAATTTSAAGTTTTLKGGNPAQTYQVPGAYQPLTPVEAGIHKVTITAALLGTNSYMYVPAPS